MLFEIIVIINELFAVAEINVKSGEPVLVDHSVEEGRYHYDISINDW